MKRLICISDFSSGFLNLCSGMVPSPFFAMEKPEEFTPRETDGMIAVIPPCSYRDLDKLPPELVWEKFEPLLDANLVTLAIIAEERSAKDDRCLDTIDKVIGFLSAFCARLAREQDKYREKILHTLVVVDTRPGSDSAESAAQATAICNRIRKDCSRLRIDSVCISASRLELGAGSMVLAAHVWPRMLGSLLAAISSAKDINSPFFPLRNESAELPCHGWRCIELMPSIDGKMFSEFVPEQARKTAGMHVAGILDRLRRSEHALKLPPLPNYDSPEVTKSGEPGFFLSDSLSWIETVSGQSSLETVLEDGGLKFIRHSAQNHLKAVGSLDKEESKEFWDSWKHDESLKKPFPGCTLPALPEPTAAGINSIYAKQLEMEQRKSAILGSRLEYNEARRYYSASLIHRSLPILVVILVAAFASLVPVSACLSAPSFLLDAQFFSSLPLINRLWASLAGAMELTHAMAVLVFIMSMAPALLGAFLVYGFVWFKERKSLEKAHGSKVNALSLLKQAESLKVATDGYVSSASAHFDSTDHFSLGMLLENFCRWEDWKAQRIRRLFRAMLSPLTMPILLEERKKHEDEQPVQNQKTAMEDRNQYRVQCLKAIDFKIDEDKSDADALAREFDPMTRAFTAEVSRLDPERRGFVDSGKFVSECLDYRMRLLSASERFTARKIFEHENSLGDNDFEQALGQLPNIMETYPMLASIPQVIAQTDRIKKRIYCSSGKWEIIKPKADGFGWFDYPENTEVNYGKIALRIDLIPFKTVKNTEAG